MKSFTKVMLTLAFIIVLVASLYFFTDWFSKVTGYFTGESQTETLVACLNKQNTQFFTAINCADCEKTKKQFGSPFSKLSVVDCGSNKINCPNIKEIPAWYINKNIYYGYKSIDELQEISNCNK